MPVSKAQQKSVNRYMKRNYDVYQIRMPKGRRAQLQSHAQMQSESLNGFIMRAIEEAIARDKAARTPAVAAHKQASGPEKQAEHQGMERFDAVPVSGQRTEYPDVERFDAVPVRGQRTEHPDVERFDAVPANSQQAEHPDVKYPDVMPVSGQPEQLSLFPEEEKQVDPDRLLHDIRYQIDIGLTYGEDVLSMLLSKAKRQPRGLEGDK